MLAMISPLGLGIIILSVSISALFSIEELIKELVLYLCSSRGLYSSRTSDSLILLGIPISSY
jgi:hypothetical protein